MAATIRDVAKYAGVSIKTVSNVINKRPYITPHTQQKVVDAIAALHYRPNRSAQALRNRRNQTLAAIIPDINNPFFTAVIRGIEDYAVDQGYMLLLCDTEDNVKREARYVEVLGAGSVAGVVMCTADERVLNQQIDALKRANMSVVAIDRATEDITVDTILVDNMEGSYTGMAHLIEKGHRRIGIIAGPDYYAPGRERLSGCLKALADAGIPVDDSLIQRTDFKMGSALEATRQLLSLPEPPTALFISNGPSASGTLEVVRERGLRIPDDLALIVFDDPDWCRFVETPLTVIAQPGYKMGRCAAEMLLNRLAQPDAPLQNVRMQTTFIHRRSCCRPSRVSVREGAV
jgi:DNA-binding LacI/PurR family transcriptional regulator